MANFEVNGRLVQTYPLKNVVMTWLEKNKKINNQEGGQLFWTCE